MPQKSCERCTFHVIVFSYFFEMPQNRRISFSRLNLFEKQFWSILNPSDWTKSVFRRNLNQKWNFEPVQTIWRWKKFFSLKTLEQFEIEAKVFSRPNWATWSLIWKRIRLNKKWNLVPCNSVVGNFLLQTSLCYPNSNDFSFLAQKGMLFGAIKTVV